MTVLEVSALNPGALSVAPDWIVLVVGYTCAVSLLAFGLWVLRRDRHASSGTPDESPVDAAKGDSAEQPATPRDPGAWLDARSRPTRLAFGLSALGVGYHVIAYLNPDQPLLKVPEELWWIVAVWVVLMIGGSLAADRLLARDQPDA